MLVWCSYREKKTLKKILILITLGTEYFLLNVQVKIYTTNDINGKKKNKNNHDCGKQTHAPLPPKIFTFESPKPVSMLPHMAKGPLWLWLNWGFWDEEINLDYQGGPNIIPEVFINERKMQKYKGEGVDMMETEFRMTRAGAKESSQLLAAEKGREEILEPIEGTQRFILAPLRSISDFWPAEL